MFGRVLNTPFLLDGQKEPFAGVLWNKCSLKFRNIRRKIFQHRSFPVNIANFLRTAFFIEHLWWLLLDGHFAFCMGKTFLQSNISLENILIHFTSLVSNWKIYSIEQYFINPTKRFPFCCIVIDMGNWKQYIKMSWLNSIERFT